MKFKLIFINLFLFLIFFNTLAWSKIGSFPLDFTTIKLGDAPTSVLVVGGIQGDEPGGFSAATLLATRYTIINGSVIVVPNLNFPSIIHRSRGLHGDMNRKFARLDSDDPEFATVSKIKDIISKNEINLVLNLHDGSGYYRPIYADKLHGPARWGQSVIIDQESLEPEIFLSNLGQQARKTAENVNKFLIMPEHAIHVRNTNTAAGDHEMEKSLSYFAVCQNKAAFGLEASKELSVALRAYYHLRMVEEFLKMAGIEFRKDFPLTPKGVEKALTENLGVSFDENRIFLPLENVRNFINYLPLSKNGLSKAKTSKPIMAVLPCEKNKEQICVHFGNRIITLIKPDWRETDNSLKTFPIVLDGIETTVNYGEIIDVKDTAIVKKMAGYRVNAIGWDKDLQDESNVPLRKIDFKERFSIDQSGSIYRIEIYKGQKFSGMFLLRYGKNISAKQTANNVKKR